METTTFLQAAKMTEEQAREHLERIRWPNGPVCPHCGVDEKPYKLKGKAHRAGVYKCRDKDCRRQFTVTVGTIFQGSHIPLRKWLLAFHIVCASKKGVSALQLQRQLDLKSYKSAWFMAHRIRHAMANDPLSGDTLKGRVEIDETYIGGKPRKHNRASQREAAKRGTSPDHKAPVMVLVERGEDGTPGRVVAEHVNRASRDNAARLIGKYVDVRARLNTDESPIYKKIGRQWPGGHDVIPHWRMYADGENHVNSAESFNGLFKRAIQGAWHHISRDHMQRYVGEFVFRWNHRKMSDAERTASALKQSPGVRLSYYPAKA